MKKAPDYPVKPVLEHYGIEVNSRGRALCAWHTETNPSLSVTRYGYRCFSCGASGDSIKLIREQEGCDYQTALARAEEIVGGAGGRIPRPASGGWGSGSLLD